MRLRPAALRPAVAAAALALLGAGCGSTPAAPTSLAAPATSRTGPAASSPTPGSAAPTNGTAAAPAAPDPAGSYRFTTAGQLSPAVAGVPERVYVPNSGVPGAKANRWTRNGNVNTVSVIDPKTFQVVDQYPVGRLPQHVTPSWDLKTLWVDASGSNQLVPVDPRTGKPGAPVRVDAPYNLYFSPDGARAYVMAERHNRIDIRDPQTMALQRSVPVPCQGINHADFSADGSYLLATCEFSGVLMKFDAVTLQVLGRLDLGRPAMPQDIRLGPDGRTFYVAALGLSKVLLVDGDTMRQTGAVPTQAGPHGLYPSRDGRQLYVADRIAGAVSVVDLATNTVVATWTIPGGSPDMGGVSADGTQLWLSGRDEDAVYVLSTTDGALLARIKVGANPHGLSVFPQPGRYSLGHTGNFR